MSVYKIVYGEFLMEKGELTHKCAYSIGSHHDTIEEARKELNDIVSIYPERAKIAQVNENEIIVCIDYFRQYKKFIYRIVEFTI